MKPPSIAWWSAGFWSVAKTGCCGYSVPGATPVIDGKAEREVKLRIMEVLFSDVIPTPRDVVIICLSDACGIFSELLSKRELRHVTPRIDLIRRMDLIGRAVTRGDPGTSRSRSRRRFGRTWRSGPRNKSSRHSSEGAPALDCFAPRLFLEPI